MKIEFSWGALFAGFVCGVLGVGFAALGHPPFSLGEAAFLAAFLVIMSAFWGFEWGLVFLLLQAACVMAFRDAQFSALLLVCVALVWYVGVTLLAARGSQVLMGISAGLLFFGLLLERMPSFSLQTWIAFVGILLLEVSGMYLAGNSMRGRWFSPYA